MERAENVATYLKILREIVNEILFITMILNGPGKIQNFYHCYHTKNSLTFSQLKGALTCFEETERMLQEEHQEKSWKENEKRTKLYVICDKTKTYRFELLCKNKINHFSSEYKIVPSIFSQ